MLINIAHKFTIVDTVGGGVLLWAKAGELKLERKQ